MLITFKSSASSDVIMFGDVARAMLATIGKDPADERGIITVAQLPAAIAALKEAMENDKAERASHSHEDKAEHDEEEAGKKGAAISFAQRAVPLIELMSYSLKEETPVIWEA